MAGRPRKVETEPLPGCKYQYDDSGKRCGKDVTGNQAYCDEHTGGGFNVRELDKSRLEYRKLREIS
jgi:hypothetical protein